MVVCAPSWLDQRIDARLAAASERVQRADLAVLQKVMDAQANLIGQLGFASPFERLTREQLHELEERVDDFVPGLSRRLKAPLSHLAKPNLDQAAQTFPASGGIAWRSLPLNERPTSPKAGVR